MREITLNKLEQLTGLYLWDNVRAGQFNKYRNKLRGGDWWKAGQAS